MLICPICQFPLKKIGKQFMCENHHHFDIAREGYVHLLISNKSLHGDNRAMVMARNQFLSYGYYDFLLNYVKKIVGTWRSFCDCGCGEGFYTKQFETFGYGVDVSKEAIKIASKSDKHHQYVIASTKHIPLRDKSVQGIVSIFAPTFVDEFSRIASDEVLIVDAGRNHLLELRQALFSNVRLKDPLVIEHPNYELIHSEVLTRKIEIDNPMILQSLLTMTPYFFKSKIDKQQAILSTVPISITLEFFVHHYKIKS